MQASSRASESVIPLCRRGPWAGLRARRSGVDPEAVLQDGEHLVDAVPQRVLGQRAAPRVLADGACLVGPRQEMVEQASQLGEITIDEQLVAGFEERPQLGFRVHAMAGPPRRQL